MCTYAPDSQQAGGEGAVGGIGGGALGEVRLGAYRGLQLALKELYSKGLIDKPVYEKEQADIVAQI